MNNAAIIAQTMNNAGFDVLPMEMDLSSRSSILSLIDEAQKHGEISMLVNVAGVSVFHRARIRVGDFGGNAFGSSEKGRLILYFYVCSSSLPYDSVKSRTCFLKLTQKVGYKSISLCLTNERSTRNILILCGYK